MKHKGDNYFNVEWGNEGRGDGWVLVVGARPLLFLEDVPHEAPFEATLGSTLLLATVSRLPGRE